MRFLYDTGTCRLLFLLAERAVSKFDTAHDHCTLFIYSIYCIFTEKGAPIRVLVKQRTPESREGLNMYLPARSIVLKMCRRCLSCMRFCAVVTNRKASLYGTVQVVGEYWSAGTCRETKWVTSQHKRNLPEIVLQQPH